MRNRILALVLAAIAIAALAMPASAEAPDRQLYPAGEFFLDQGWCDPDRQGQILVVGPSSENRRHVTFSTDADENFIETFTGPVTYTFFNPDLATFVDAVLGGPGRFEFSVPVGQVLTAKGSGRWVFWGPNLVDFGFPSNIVATTGPFEFVQTRNGAPAYADWPVVPRVTLDICEASDL